MIYSKIMIYPDSYEFFKHGKRERCSNFSQPNFSTHQQTSLNPPVGPNSSDLALGSSRYDDKSRALELCGLRHQVMDVGWRVWEGEDVR